MRHHTAATDRSRREFLFLGAASATSLMLSVGRHSCLSAAEMPTELFRASASQLAELIRHKKVSSLEVVNACLERIAQVNPKLNAVVALVAEDARANAIAADQKLARGEAVGPLHGVPMTIKDSLDTASVISTAGTPGRKNFIPKEDATVVKRLSSLLKKLDFSRTETESNATG